MNPWIYVLLMVLVMLLTAYELIWSYREYRKSKQKTELVRFIGKILCLLALIVVLIWMINEVVTIAAGV